MAVLLFVDKDRTGRNVLVTYAMHIAVAPQLPYMANVWVIRFKIQLMSQSRLKCHEYASKNFFRDSNICHKTEASIQTGIV